MARSPGANGLVNFVTRLMNRRRVLEAGEKFEPPRDPELFRAAHPGSNASSPEWVAAGGGEIDPCAVSSRRQAEGIWDPVTQRWTA
jgi:hypothetical protein